MAWVAPLRGAHLALVAASGTLFALRGVGVLAGARWPMRPALRVGSVLIDTLLLAAGATLWALLRLDPLRERWLGAKLALLLLYVVLGSLALKRTSRAGYAAALIVFATMASIGWTRDPLGLWRGLVP